MENSNTTNLCSCIVHTRPERGPEVEKLLNSIPGVEVHGGVDEGKLIVCLLYTSPSPRDSTSSRMPSSA